VNPYADDLTFPADQGVRARPDERAAGRASLRPFQPQGVAPTERMAET